jgi:hypothetical protein
MGGVSPVAERGAIIDGVTIRVSVCLRSSGPAPDAANARMAASASALHPRALIVPSLFRKRTQMATGMRSTLQIGKTNSANTGIDIRIDAKRLSCPKNSTNVWEKRPPANSEIDNKNRADITVGPVVKN